MTINNNNILLSLQRWTDEKFRWNVSEYNGIRTLRVPASYVWLPDTFIFNKLVVM